MLVCSHLLGRRKFLMPLQCNVHMQTESCNIFRIYSGTVSAAVHQANTHTRGSFLSMLWLLAVQEARDDRMHRKMFICRQSEAPRRFEGIQEA